MLLKKTVQNRPRVALPLRVPKSGRLAMLKRSADAIRKVRNDHGMTLSEFARAIGYKHPSISRWESAVSFASTEALIAIHQRFRKPLPWLMGVEDAPEQPIAVAQLPEGQTISEEQLDHALRQLAARAIESRAQLDDRIGHFLTHYIHVNGVDALVPVSPTGIVIDRLVTLAENASVRYWEWGAPARVGREVARELSPELGPLAVLAATLTREEIGHAKYEAYDEAHRRRSKVTAYQRYREATEKRGESSSREQKRTRRRSSADA